MQVCFVHITYTICYINFFQKCIRIIFLLALVSMYMRYIQVNSIQMINLDGTIYKEIM